MSTEENNAVSEHTTETETTSKNLIWPEIKKAGESKRYELCLVGSEISQRIESNGGYLDSNLYKLTHLNFLEIAKTKLSTLPKQIGQIKNLTSLLCHTNELTSIPAEIGLLTNLKNLDFSNNKITSLPTELSNLKELFTVNLSGNQLTELFPLNDLVKLSVLDISRNKMKKLPALGSCNLENLSEINGSFNELVEMPDDLVDLPSLKLLNLQNNQITHVPSNLSQCHKLKDLLLKENKIKDNRLKKLIEQDQKIKSILDYLKKIYDEEAKSKPKKTSTDKAKNSRTSKTSIVQEFDLLKVVHFNDEKLTSKQVMIMDTVNEVRPYILCTILRDIDLESGNNFKKFLTIQTKIQDEKCEKRTLATIATHDLASIKSNNLIYDAACPLDVQLVPLGRKNLISARDFYDKLLDEAENERKQKKRNQVSGIYKYLTLLDGAKLITYLSDENKNVLSLPPLTNSDSTRMSTSTKDILIEITSSDSIDICKQVMEQLIVEMLNAGITSRVTDLSEQVENLNLNNSTASDSSENIKPKNTLIMQQVKTVDSKGNLKTVYPSRVDLNFTETTSNIKIKVARLYDD